MIRKMIAPALAVWLLVCGTAATLGHFTNEVVEGSFSLHVSAVEKNFFVGQRDITVPQSGYLTFDVIIDGITVANDVQVHEGSYPEGAMYQITDIKGTNDYFREMYYNALEGVITEDGIELQLISHAPDANRFQVYTGDRLTFDVYIDGELSRQNVTSYYFFLFSGTEYLVTNIKAAEGFTYSGPEEYSGTMGEENFQLIINDEYITPGG